MSINMKLWKIEDNKLLNCPRGSWEDRLEEWITQDVSILVWTCLWLEDK